MTSDKQAALPCFRSLVTRHVSLVMIDLAIIGGGPAGTAAALEARRRGLRVTIWERDRFPRDKVCGEFVSAESLPLLEQDIPAALERGAVIRTAEFISRSGRVHAFSLPRAGRGLSRRVMDEALWRAAAASGAETREGEAIHRVITGKSGGVKSEVPRPVTGEEWQVTGPGSPATRHSSRVTAPGARDSGLWSERLSPDATVTWELESAHDTVRTRALLVACGRWWALEGLPSPARQVGAPLGVPSAAGPWLGAKAHFRGISSRHAVEMYFFPGGYCGLAPIEDGLYNACCLVHRRLARDVGPCGPGDFSRWIRALAQHPALEVRLRGGSQASETVTTAPVRPARRRADEGSILLVGDAAGFLDPFTGDGISMALHSGRLAAETLAVNPGPAVSNSSLEAAERAARAYRHRLAHAVRRSYAVAGIIRLLVRAPAEVQAAAATAIPWLGTRLLAATRWRDERQFLCR